MVSPQFQPSSSTLYELRQIVLCFPKATSFFRDLVNIYTKFTALFKTSLQTSSLSRCLSFF